MEDIFEKELQKPTLFLDRNVLSAHYIPETLPHREKQIEEIMKILAPALSGKRSHNLFIYGKTGVGKTAVTKHVINRLLEVRKKYNVSVDTIYVNCRVVNTKYQVMLRCAEYCNPAENYIGFPFSHLYSRFIEHLKETGKNFVIVLDEVDKVKNLDDLLYSLTRANDELDNAHVQVIGITNNVNLKDELDPRSKSTLCEEEMIFPPYNADQLREILFQRVKIGYKKNSVDKSAINLASALSAKESGDARYALKLILKAGEIADSKERKKIIDKHVKEARKGVEDEIVYEIINTLPEHQKIVLYSIAKLTGEGGKYKRLDGMAEDQILFSGEVYERYERICSQLAKDARSARWCREYLNDLEMLGLITTSISGKGVRGNTTLVRLAFPPDKIQNVIEKNIMGEIEA